MFFLFDRVKLFRNRFQRSVTIRQLPDLARVHLKNSFWRPRRLIPLLVCVFLGRSVVENLIRFDFFRNDVLYGASSLSFDNGILLLEIRIASQIGIERTSPVGSVCRIPFLIVKGNSNRRFAIFGNPLKKVRIFRRGSVPPRSGTSEPRFDLEKENKVRKIREFRSE